MEYRVREVADGVYIEISDKTEGWLPLFGANMSKRRFRVPQNSNAGGSFDSMIKSDKKRLETILSIWNDLKIQIDQNGITKENLLNNQFYQWGSHYTTL